MNNTSDILNAIECYPPLKTDNRIKMYSMALQFLVLSKFKATPLQISENLAIYRINRDKLLQLHNAFEIKY